MCVIHIKSKDHLKVHLIYMVQTLKINSPATFVETFRWPAFTSHQPEMHEPPQFSKKCLKLPQITF
jgi:hypothetical protein